MGVTDGFRSGGPAQRLASPGEKSGTGLVQRLRGGLAAPFRDLGGKDLRRLLQFLLLLHVGLLAFDYFHPDALLGGDRAPERLTQIRAFFEAAAVPSSLVGFLSSHNIPGDYLFHAIGLAVVGRVGVLALQVVLAVTAAVFLYRLALLVTHSHPASLAATLTYSLLPHTVAFPHLLVTESLFSPLLLISSYYLVSHIYGQAERHLYISAALIAVATMIRPLIALFPVLVAAVLLFSGRGASKRRLAGYLAICWLPLAIWLGFLYATTGELRTGGQNQFGTFNNNLYIRATRFVPGGVEGVAAAYPEEAKRKSLSQVQYVRLLIEHRGAFARSLKFHFSNMFLNSGINKLLGYYLKVYEPRTRKYQVRYWAEITKEEGLMAAARAVMREPPIYVAANGVGGLMWLFFSLGAGLGAVLFLCREEIRRPVKWVLMLLPVYLTGVTIAVVGQTRSGHRAPFEFVMALTFAFLVVWFEERAGARKARPAAG